MIYVQSIWNLDRNSLHASVHPAWDAFYFFYRLVVCLIVLMLECLRFSRTTTSLVLPTMIRPVTRGRRGAKPPLENFSPPSRAYEGPLEKCVGYSLKLLDTVQKIWTPLSKLFAPPGVPSWLRAWLWWVYDAINWDLFFFTFHQLVDAWRKFANSVSIFTMLRNNRNNRLQECLFI